jgi:DinB family protein
MDAIREHLLSLLSGKGAHADFDDAVKDIAPAMRGKRPKGADHSPWELLEHLRIAQSDILEYVRDPKHASPEWPSGYWPKSPAPPSDDAWDESVAAFKRDLRGLEKLVKDETSDLTAPMKHTGDARHTLLREVLLAADHNAYHVGQLVLIRKILGAWSE